MNYLPRDFMQNSKTNSANSASQPVLPFSTAPLDFSQPVECRFHQLAAVRDKAAAAGWRIIRMAVIPLGYRLTFQCDTSASQVT